MYTHTKAHTYTGNDGGNKGHIDGVKRYTSHTAVRKSFSISVINKWNGLNDEMIQGNSINNLTCKHEE